MTTGTPNVGGRGETETRGDSRLHRFSVVLIGVLLGILSIAGEFVGTTGFDTVRAAIPLAASLAILAGGLRLFRTDLTGIGMGIVKCTRDIDRGIDDGLRLSVLSLSTILQYANDQRVFNFLHTITGRVSAANYLGIATLDPTTQGTQETNTLTSLFDAVVELREADDGSREMRVIGLPDVPRTWVSF